MNNDDVDDRLCDKDGNVNVNDFTNIILNYDDYTTQEVNRLCNDGLEPVNVIRKLRPLNNNNQVSNNNTASSSLIITNDDHDHDDDEGWVWRGYHAMEVLSEVLEKKEYGHGGRLKANNVFNRIDMDGDGYITLSDIKNAVKHYNIPLNGSDQLALLKVLDKDYNHGSVNLPQFTRSFLLNNNASILDSLKKQFVGVIDKVGGGGSGGGMYVIDDNNISNIINNKGKGKTEQEEEEQQQKQQKQEEEVVVVVGRISDVYH
ncbi:hypothetical protein FOL47_002738 [Perkinsus chesapeaki]|uniref:EF-hand domain-containing protein n=1 Tax=Perkinsus chesapeaki TaxID=330153 RepID=A0A7J6MBL5_PERCH|nr:hypothetical protein FOL47_002738 [Perkinsus chesapeaki]